MQLQCLLQKGRSIDDYMKEFQYLFSCNDVMEDEDQEVGWYVGGLRPSLQKAMFVHPCYTLTETIQHTTSIEKSQAIEIPRSRTSIPQSSKDESLLKKYGQQFKEDNASGPLNQPTQMGRWAPNADDKGKRQSDHPLF